MNDNYTIESSKAFLLKELRTTSNHAGVAQAYKILADAQAVEANTAINQANAEFQMESNRKQVALQLRGMEQQLNDNSPLKP